MCNALEHVAVPVRKKIAVRIGSQIYARCRVVACRKGTRTSAQYATTKICRRGVAVVLQTSIRRDITGVHSLAWTQAKISCWASSSLPVQNPVIQAILIAIFITSSIFSCSLGSAFLGHLVILREYLGVVHCVRGGNFACMKIRRAVPVGRTRQRT